MVCGGYTRFHLQVTPLGPYRRTLQAERGIFDLQDQIFDLETCTIRSSEGVWMSLRSYFFFFLPSWCTWLSLAQPNPHLLILESGSLASNVESLNPEPVYTDFLFFFDH